MNGIPRRPLTALEKAVPPIRRAYDEFERALAQGSDLAIARAWKHVEDVREAHQLGQQEADTA